MLVRKTLDMENAARFLSLRYERGVIVYDTYRLSNKIRYRPAIFNLSMWIVRQRTGQQDQFVEHGGVVRWQGTQDFPPHEAVLFCECPMSIKNFERRTRDTASEAVIYVPPTWEEHALAIWTRARPNRLRKRMLGLRKMVEYVESLPEFTPKVYNHEQSRAAVSAA